MFQLNMARIDGELEQGLEQAHGLDSAAKREWQRRGTAEQEMAATVPPDVIAVLTEGTSIDKTIDARLWHVYHKYIEAFEKYVCRVLCSIF